MSTKTSSIHHPPRTRMNLLRESYLAIADGDYCAARLLNVFERWHNTKLDQRAQARYANAVARAGGERPDQDQGLWVYMSNEDLRRELMNEYSEKPVTRALTLLETKGFIRRRNNPVRKWDRKPQYLLVASAVQAAIDLWAANRAEEAENDPLHEHTEPTDSTPLIDGLHSAEVRTPFRKSAESSPQSSGLDSAEVPRRFRNLADSTPSMSGSNTTGFNTQVSSTGFLPQEEETEGSSSQAEEENLAPLNLPEQERGEEVSHGQSAHQMEEVPGAARALLERHLGGSVGLANLLLEVPASGVDRRQWLTLPEARVQVLIGEAHGQQELVFRTYLIRALDVEIGSLLALPSRPSREIQQREDARNLLTQLHEGDLVRSRKTGSTFRVVSVTDAGIDIEIPGYRRPVSVSAGQIVGYERVD